MVATQLQEDVDLQIRLAAVDQAQRLRDVWGDAVPAGALSAGFVFGSQRIHLVTWGRGIFKPQQLSDGPLTLVSSLKSRYSDEQVDGGTLHYDFASHQSDEWANAALQRVSQLGRPVIFLKQVKPKPDPEYLVFAPTFVIRVDKVARKFHLGLTGPDSGQVDEATITGVIEKRYRRSEVQIRLHQAHFRRNVLQAYRDRCCTCSLRERRLLDAAHITSDRDINGDPVVSNGLAMCPSHHRAFDRHLFSVDSEYRVSVHADRLEFPQSDAVRHLLDRFHGNQIILPKERHFYPDPARLATRAESDSAPPLTQA